MLVAAGCVVVRAVVVGATLDGAGGGAGVEVSSFCGTLGIEVDDVEGLLSDADDLLVLTIAMADETEVEKEIDASGVFVDVAGINIAELGIVDVLSVVDADADDAVPSLGVAPAAPMFMQAKDIFVAVALVSERAASDHFMSM